MRQSQEILESLQTHIGVRAPIEAGQTNAAVRGNIVGKNSVSDFEDVRPGDRNVERNLRIAVERLKHVANRPPQPVREIWSGTEVCHCTDWSAWEKSCGGTAAPPARYCARVIGATRVPTLATMPRWPWLKSDCNSDEVRMETEIAAIAVLAG